jgi:hypothetical protein
MKNTEEWNIVLIDGCLIAHQSITAKDIQLKTKTHPPASPSPSLEWVQVANTKQYFVKQSGRVGHD